MLGLWFKGFDQPVAVRCSQVRDPGTAGTEPHALWLRTCWHRSIGFRV